ncbi:MAG: hypothetical protein RL430_1714 [Actinomycetota bacterium]|jgi:hypothetical protein|nr:hypothetical protein [Actinomycetota bacterium]
MPMRTECKHYESRTYANGDAVRKCNLDLAPEAPWRCPDECARYERRLADVAWVHGSAITPPTPDEVPGLDDGSAAAVLDEAEAIVNAVGFDLMAEIEAEQNKKRRWWRRKK